jgi:YheC/D like ATP-grasp
MYRYTGLDQDKKYEPTYVLKGFNLIDMISDPFPSKIGILSNFFPDRNKPIGQQTGFIEACLQTAEKYSIGAAVFDPRYLAENKTSIVNGYIFRSGSWIRKPCTFPIVLYDRYYSSLSGFNPSVELSKNRLAECCRFYNPLNFAKMATNKEVFFTKLTEYGVKTPRIIVGSLTSSEELERVLSWNDSVIMKPVYGRMGRGIIRVDKETGRGGYSVLVNETRLVSKTSSELWGIIRYVAREQDITPGHYMIQDKIDTCHMKNRWFDVRILMQRTGKGPPGITGSVIRVSAGKMAVPNLDRGGLAMEVEQWMRQLGNSVYAGSIQMKLNKTAADLYCRLEADYGMIGEIGMDMIIDRKNNVWVVEVNSKPGRWAFVRLSTGFGMDSKRKAAYLDLRKQSIDNIITYCRSMIMKSNGKE